MLVVGGDQARVAAWQFVNRWVFFKHHRAPALRELNELIDKVRAGTW